MINLFYEGGVLFMSIISFFFIMTGVSFYTHSDKLKTYGNLGLASGILGSFIGLYSAFEFIQQSLANLDVEVVSVEVSEHENNSASFYK